MSLVITPWFGAVKIGDYIKRRGYEGAKKALSIKPEDVIEEVKKSNLRGRGGAGFPTGLKWSFVPRETDKPKYLCVNADEGEPGTFKDRYIIENAPHLIIEGAVIASWAVGIHRAYVYIRGEYLKFALILEKAIEEAYQRGFLGKNIFGKDFSLDIYIHRGAGAYVCGEETALIESLEGKRGNPRVRPPFPATNGLYDCPTVVNNVETIACLPYILREGGENFASLGVEKNGGTKLFAVSGHVKDPGVYELPMGSSLRELIYNYAGGVRGNRRLKAVIPGGSSSSILMADEIDVSLDYDSMIKAGTMLGSGAVIVLDETACMAEVLRVITRFYAHESCGQCTPCRQGTSWMAKIAERIAIGKGKKGDIDLLLDIAHSIMGKTICPLGDAAAMPVIAICDKFRSELEEQIRERRCPIERE